MSWNRIELMVAEGTGAPDHMYAGADVTVLCKSVKRGIRLAHRKADEELSRKWDELGIWGGGCCVLMVTKINGREVK